MTVPPWPPYSALKVWVKTRTSANSFNPRKYPEAPAGKAENRISRIHTVDQNVRHTRTYAINCHLPGLTVRKQRRTAAGVRSDSRLQRDRTVKIAVVERQFRQALLWKQSIDSRCCVINGGNVRAHRSLLGKVAYRELRIYDYFGSRSELNSFANLRLESCFLYTKRIGSNWQAGKTVLAGRVSKGVPLQSSALAGDRNADSGDNGATWVGDGAGNCRKLGLRPSTDRKERRQNS
jgi:hypothetical protein